MNRFMFVVGPANRAGLRPVFLKDGRRLVAYVCERNGKGAGYWWRFPWMDNWAKGRHKTIKSAVLAMGAKL